LAAGSVLPFTFGTWKPSPALGMLGGVLPLLTTSVSFRFTAINGAAAIDDVYLDPMKSRNASNGTKRARRLRDRRALCLLAADCLGDREISEPVLQPLELGRVGVELGGAGATLSQNLADQDEASDVQQQVVDLPRAHAASST